MTTAAQEDKLMRFACGVEEGMVRDSFGNWVDYSQAADTIAAQQHDLDRLFEANSELLGENVRLRTELADKSDESQSLQDEMREIVIGIGRDPDSDWYGIADDVKKLAIDLSALRKGDEISRLTIEALTRRSHD